MRAQKIPHHILVLAREHRARRIHQHTARTHARCKALENVALDDRQLRERRRVFEADLRLLADNAQSRARHVRQHDVHRADQIGIRTAGIHRARRDARQSQPLGTGADTLPFIFVYIAGNHTSLIAHLHRGGKAFAARRGAGIEHAHPRADTGGKHCAVRGRVLHIKPAVGKGACSRKVSAAAEQCIRQPRVRLRLNAVGAQRRGQGIRCRFQGVHLQTGRRVGVVCQKRALGKVIAVRVDEHLRQPLRMAAAHGEIGRCTRTRYLRQCVTVLRHAAQDRIDQSCCARTAALPAERDRLIHGSTRRDFIQQHDLIRRQPQKVEHLRLEFLQRRRAVCRKVMIQQRQILQRPVADARCECSVTRLKLRILQHDVERGIRPCAVFAPALQRGPCRFPCSHSHAQPSMGSVCPSR